MKSVALIVLNNFRNDSRVLKEAVSLQKGGYRVKVVALYEEGVFEHETVQGIPVHRIRLSTRSWSKSLPVQLIKYLEFWWHFARLYHQCDIYHCNDLNTLPIGVSIKALLNRKAKVVYDAHEYETERNGEAGIRKKAAKLTERLFIRKADAVITVSRGIAREYKRLYKIQEPYLILNVPNFRRSTTRKDLFRRELGITGEQTIFLYQGGLTKGRGIKILLETFASLVDKNTVVVFMGNGPLAQLVRDFAEKNDNIYYREAVSPEILYKYTASADYGVLLYENTCLNHYYASPNKLFEYIMAEIPLIVSNLYEMNRIVSEHNIGIVVQEYTVAGLKDTVNRVGDLNRHTIAKKTKELKKKYNWENQEKVLLDIYHGL